MFSVSICAFHIRNYICLCVRNLPKYIFIKKRIMNYHASLHLVSIGQQQSNSKTNFSCFLYQLAITVYSLYLE
jgi:hypothetical protein